MMIISEEIHLFIFCEKKYKPLFLNSCITSIEKNVKDKIISWNIVSNEKFEYPGFNVIHDDDIWDIIDPKSEFKESKIYNDPWVKQQILKLSCDRIEKGNILIVDADLFFLKPVKFIENNKFNFYMAEEYCKPYFDTIKNLLDIDKIAKDSFVSDFILFNSNILYEIKSYIEQKFNSSWINAIADHLLKCDNHVKAFSEYEMYGNYLMSKHPELINRNISPIDYKPYVIFGSIFGPKDANIVKEIIFNPENFLNFLKSKSNNYYQSVK